MFHGWILFLFVFLFATGAAEMPKLNQLRPIELGGCQKKSSFRALRKGETILEVQEWLTVDPPGK